VVCTDSHAVFSHCTIADNNGGLQGAGICLVNSNVVLTNSIIWDNTPKAILASGTSQPSITYTDVTGGWSGLGNIHTDPLFARPGYWANAEDPSVVVGPEDPMAVWTEGDYHLRSQAGRWDPATSTWVQDDLTSPCIDAGDPTGPVGYEPLPNGGVLNAGAYGGTLQASRSYVAEPVDFASPLLKSKVEAALGVLDPTPTDMLGLTSLTATWGASNLRDLTGLEYAVNLQTLVLNDNQIYALGPLSGLSNLRTLDVSDNQVLWDLSGLSGLTGLQLLDVHRNAVRDLGPLSGLAGLRTLVLRNNEVSNVKPLGSLTGLEVLNLHANTVNDISPLTSLTSLNHLDLTSNPLGSSTYWSDLQKVYDNNPGIWLSYDLNPGPPAGVSASDGTYPDRVRITWNELQDGPKYTTYYRVYRATSATDPKTPISAWQTDRTFDDTTAQSAKTYFYWVQAAPFSDGSQATDYSAYDTGSRG